MAVVLQPMKLALGLTDAQVGAINTAYFIGIIVCTLPVANLVDAWSRKKMIGLMALTWSGFTLVTGFVGGFHRRQQPAVLQLARRRDLETICQIPIGRVHAPTTATHTAVSFLEVCATPALRSMPCVTSPLTRAVVEQT